MTRFILSCSIVFFLWLGFGKIVGPVEHQVESPHSPEEYTLVGNQEGVNIYWKRVLNPYTDRYNVYYKFENTKAFCASIKYTATFTCGENDHSAGKPDQGAKFIPRYQVREGEADGLYALTNPCRKGVLPTGIQFKAEISLVKSGREAAGSSDTKE